MHVDHRRIAGAFGFAAFCTALFSIGQLFGDGAIDIAAIAGMLSMGVILGYLAWPGLADVWGRRDRSDDRKRLLLIGVGVAGGLGLSRAVSFLAGGDAARWSLVLWAVSVAAIFLLVMRQVRRARRSQPDLWDSG
jgi:MFS family permease